MQVTIPPELEAFVSFKLANGNYGNADAVVSEALDALRAKDEGYQRQLKSLREELSEGIQDLERGRSAPMDALDILAKVRTKRSTP